MSTYTYLALGDSYTIGESVPLYESFPCQAVQLLRKAGHRFNAPEIIAKTGWTTDELFSNITHTRLQPPYDFVSLLIGVNNQYRGRTVDEYKTQFTELLQQSIAFSNSDPSRVMVLSIPDWGITPFASGRDQQKISGEIDAFNAVNKSIAEKFKTHYIDITPGTREAAQDESLLAADKLHPSGKEYGRWAAEVVRMILARIRHKVQGTRSK
ncbi:MAG: SGNH/GDSL hydrolase family protein [Chitinophagaceae bacterium]